MARVEESRKGGTKVRKRHIRFSATDEERELIRRIASRVECLTGMNNPEELLSLSMDLAATHKNGCPLDLERLAGFDDFNLMHDVIGIHTHLDRATGRLTGHFLPRCARKEAAA